jgi:hypothetical protein
VGLLKGLFGKRSKESKQQGTSALVMPLLPAGDVDWHAVFGQASRRSPDFPRVAPHVEGMVATADIAGCAVAASLMPIPVPSNDLAGPVAVAYHWPDAATVIAGHEQHAIIFARSDTVDAVDVHLLVSRLAAASLEVANGIGMYVGHAMLVRDAAGYISDISSASREEVPVTAWVGFNAVNDEGALAAYTTGLTAFGFRELEIRRTSLEPDTVMNTLMNVASYQLSTGRVLKHGETIGYSETQRNTVRYAPSAFIPEMEVAVIELQAD